MAIKNGDSSQDDLPPLSAEIPSLHELPPNATPTQLAHAYGTLALFFVHQWPALINELKRIHRRLDHIEHDLPPRIRWELLVFIVVVAMLGAFVLGKWFAVK
jgi:hypothetical protein